MKRHFTWFKMETVFFFFLILNFFGHIKENTVFISLQLDADLAGSSKHFMIYSIKRVQYEEKVHHLSPHGLVVPREVTF